MTIEVDITQRCNLACRHCNRLCNAEANYGIVSRDTDMSMSHIHYLIQQIKTKPKGSISMVRVLGGEPLMSPIIADAITALESLVTEGYITTINIVTNGTLPIPEVCRPYIVYAPQIIGELIRRKKSPLTAKEVYAIKNVKHRNITISPKDFGLPYRICDRVNICGIHYTVYGFALTAPCFPSLMISRKNHKYFLNYLPDFLEELSPKSFSKDVCSLCNFAIEDYKKLCSQHPEIQDRTYYGETWSSIINENKSGYIEPSRAWITEILNQNETK